MRKKIKEMPEGQAIEKLVDGMNNNDFRIVPMDKMNQLSDVFSESHRELLDSSVYGLSGDCFFAISHRIDPIDDPNLINTEIIICEYDLDTQEACLSGCLLYRGGEWHHNTPTDLVTTSLNYNQIGIMKDVLQIQGDDFDDNVKSCIHDAYTNLKNP